MHAPLSSLLLLRPYRGLALALLPALLLMALIARPALAEGPTILYVDADATSGSNTGSSWPNAYTHLQDALDQANGDGSTDYEIWVAEGVYYPDEDSDGDHTNNSQSEYFTLRYNNVRLYGGFVATETERSQRDWAANLTILSGDIDGNDTPPGGVITDTANIVGSNADHVLYLDGRTNEVMTGATVIDGFTITAGQANGSAPHSYGGGLYCAGASIGNECSPSLANVSFSGNSASRGGGMYNSGDEDGVSSPDLTNVSFNGNSAADRGGGMYNLTLGSSGQSSPKLTNVSFSGNNSVGDGGGMVNYSSNGGQSSPSLTNVSFSGNNSANGAGGGMRNYSDDGVSSPNLVNVSFSGNSAISGGGMFNYAVGSSAQSSPNLVNVTFSGNLANYYGGGMHNRGHNNGVSSPSLVNVTFSGNNSAISGGGMYNYGSSGGQSSPSLVNAILWGNAAGSGGAQVSNDSATPVFSYTLVEGGISGSGISNVNGGSITDGGNNLAADPLFVAPITATNAPTTTGNYRLQAGSPAIDAGNSSAITTTTDLAGNARIQGGTVDLGAYEFAPPPALTAFSPTRNAITATLNSSVVLTYSADIDAATVTSRTVAIHSMMHGLVTETYSVSGAVVTVNPTRDFFPGELVYASATTRTTDITGTQPLSSTVWQFTAAAGVGPATFDAVAGKNFGPGDDFTGSVALGDVDGDGDLDAVVGNSGQNVVYLNNGDGTFAAAGQNFGTGSDDTQSVALGDVDGDGDLDAAVGNDEKRPNAVYLNNGDGSFAATGHNFGTGGDETNSVALGDVDGDGDLDIAVGNYSGIQYISAQNVVYLNNGDGTFAATGHNFGPGDDETFSVALGDVDGDGDLDAAVGNGGQQNVVYLNNGDGSFAAAGHNFGTGGDDTRSVALGDVDGDGDLDLAVGNRNQQNVVYLNNGDGSFAATGHNFGTGGDDTRSVALGDVDGDGDLDAAVGNLGQQNLVYLNNGDGSFAGTGRNFGTGSDATRSVALGDVDGDGDLDAAVGNGGQQNVVYLNQLPPDVSIVKTVSPLSAQPGAAITYTLAFSNAGGSTATDVVITDRVPVSVTNVSVVSSSGAAITPTGAAPTPTGAAPTFVWQVADLGPNEGGVITLTGILTEPLAAGHIFTNTAAITATADSDPANNAGAAGLTITNAAPVARDDTAMVRRDDNGDLSILATQPVTIPVLLNDSDPNSGDNLGLTLSAVGVPSQGGTVASNSNNRWVEYRPAAAFTGSESFTYTVSDGGLSAMASVTVTVVEGDGGTGVDPGDSDGETLVIPGTGLSGTITVTVQIPAGVATDTLVLVYNEVETPSGAAPEGFVLAGLSFTLDAYLNQQWQPGYVFATPISLIIDYNDEDVANLPRGEESLELRYWDGSQWRSDGISKLSQDTARNRVVFQLEHLTEFALFGAAQSNVYLPLLLKAGGGAPRPDLVVDSLTAGPGGPRLTIRNAGSAPVTDAFWVDVYFNPSQTPALNKPWNSIAPAGATWGVTANIQPGGSLTLTVGDSYYFPQYSSGSFPAGVPVYGYVDSVNYATGYGAVRESDEGNNLFGPVTSTAGSGAASVGGQGDRPAPGGLPQR